MKKTKILSLLTGVSCISAITPLITTSCSKTGVNFEEGDRDFLISSAQIFKQDKYNDAIARQPEAKTQIDELASVSDELLFQTQSPLKYCAICLATGLAIQSIARQPEAFERILLVTINSFNDIIENENYKALAIGYASARGADGAARQPEAIDKILTCYKFFIDELRTSKTFDEASGMGYAAGKALEGIARQPDVDQKILSSLRITFDYCHLLSGLELKPNIEYKSEFINNVNGPYFDWETGCVTYCRCRSSGRCVDVGFIGAWVAEGTARQPEADGFMMALSSRMYECYRSINDMAKSRALGATGNSSIEFLARNPEGYDEFYKLFNAMSQYIIDLDSDRATSLIDIYDGYSYKIGRRNVLIPVDYVDKAVRELTKLFKMIKSESSLIIVKKMVPIAITYGYNLGEISTDAEFNTITQQFWREINELKEV